MKRCHKPAIANVIIESRTALRIDGRDQAAEERSVPYYPMSNGAAETGVRLVKGSIRTLWRGLEKRLGHRVPVTHPVMSWLVSHAAATRTFRGRGQDGQTAYQKIRGRPFSTKLFEFGEHCRFKLRLKEPMKDGSMAFR